MALKASQKSLKKWTKQKWRTPSGKKSSETGEVYAPSAKIKKLVDEYEEEFNQKPSLSEIADALGETENMIQASLDSTSLYNLTSLDATIGAADGSRSIAEVISDDSQLLQDEELEKQKLMEGIKRCLARLDEREEKILRLRFGIVDDFENDSSFDLNSEELKDIKNKGELS